MGAALQASELRAALDRALSEADSDERVGPLISATRMRMRLEFTDPGIVLNVAAGEKERNLVWSFGDDPTWLPKLELVMDSEVGNRYLQGRESLAVGIVRGRVRYRGESRFALLYLPATKLISDSYRRVIEADFPALAAA
jgi:hypothetical protein